MKKIKKSLFIVKQHGACDYQQALNTLTLWLQSCGNGQYQLSLTRVQQRRSISQNALMWLWFSAISEAWTDASDTTFTIQDVHDAYCLQYLPKNTPKGRVAGSTSNLTTEQMTEFLHKVQADAATEYGITLPNPEEQYFEAWAEQYTNR